MISEIKKLFYFLKIQKKKNRIFFLENNFSKNHILPYVKKNKNHEKSLIISLNTKFDNKIYNNCENIIVKNKIILFFIFLFVKTKYCYSTTPDLGYTLFVKSVFNNTKYIYLQHSQISLITGYRFNAFKKFDVIQVCNSFQNEEILFLNKIHNKKIKPFKLKYLFFSNMKKMTGENKKYDILIAPTWNTNFFSKDVISTLVNTLRNDFTIKIKPHYMSILKDKDYKKNLHIFEQYLILDKLNFNNFNYLISDWSGIFLEYSIYTNKKSILINTNQKINNEKKNMIFPKSIEEDARTYLSKCVNINEIDKIPSLIKNKMFNNVDYEVRSYIKNFFYH